MANGDLFGELSFKPYVSQYLGAPIDETFRASVIARQRHDQNVQAIDNLQNYWNTLKAGPAAGHQQALQEKISYYNNRLNEVVAGRENLVDANAAIRSVAREFKEDMAAGDLGKIQTSYQNYMAQQQAWSEMEPEERHMAYASQIGYGAELQRWHAQGGVDPETGELITLGASPWHSYMDPNKYFGDDIFADIHESVRIEAPEQGWGLKEIKGVTESRIAMEAFNQMENFNNLPEDLRNQLSVDIATRSDEELSEMASEMMDKLGASQAEINANLDLNDRNMVERLAMADLISDYGERFTRDSVFKDPFGGSGSSTGPSSIVLGSQLGQPTEYFASGTNADRIIKEIEDAKIVEFDKDGNLDYTFEKWWTPPLSLPGGVVVPPVAMLTGRPAKQGALAQQISNTRNNWDRISESTGLPEDERAHYKVLAGQTDEQIWDMMKAGIRNGEEISTEGMIVFSNEASDYATKQAFGTKGSGLASASEVRYIGEDKNISDEWTDLSRLLKDFDLDIWGADDLNKLQDVRESFRVIGILPFSGGTEGGNYVVAGVDAEGKDQIFLMKPSVEVTESFKRSATLSQPTVTGLESHYDDGQGFVYRAFPVLEPEHPENKQPYFETSIVVYHRDRLERGSNGEWIFDDSALVIDDNTGNVIRPDLIDIYRQDEASLAQLQIVKNQQTWQMKQRLR